ncbi:MAG TPA: hypothetical protein VG456_22055 [Candidatus Sulfopaludibacter sp.]|jgi:hypothetical protein|nr:hypothetical protein [Candidatus Sulfopaludibacter sp.]
MDLRAYYQKIRETEAKLTDAFPVVVGCDPQNSGKPGVCTEVSRSLAAKMLAEGTVREATADEAKAFRKAQADARRAVEEAEAARTVQFKVVSMDDVRKLAGGAKGAQDRA